MDSIRYPTLRDEVRAVVSAFADPEFQTRVWVRRIIDLGAVEDINEYRALLYDDTEVLPDPTSAVGVLLYPEEVPWMLAFGRALAAVQRDMSDPGVAAEYVVHPEWPTVIAAAQAVIDHWVPGPPRGRCMTDVQTTLEWLAAWYAQQVDGEWEHEFGVAIGTLDNPGWSVRVDLRRTSLADAPYDAYELTGEARWLRCWKDHEACAWCGVGDPSALPLILDQFRGWVCGFVDGATPNR